MAKSKGGGPKPPAKGSNPDRNNGKAFKKRPKVFDKIKRKLVNKEK
jgi:hypothetical protein